MLKKILISLVLILALVAGTLYLFVLRPSEPGFELEQGYSYLYNGINLEGWRVIGGESTFEADGEDIVGRHGPGNNTFLRTEKAYGDFSLKMQMRWDEPGNSGVLFRAQQRDGVGPAYGYQYELDHSERAWSGGIYDESRRGWLANLEENEAARAAVRLDDWNDIEIEARGSSLKTTINGVPAADIVDGLDAEGFIALQVHSGNFGVMRWRRIRIQELPPLAQPGASLASVDEWRLENIADLTFSGTTIKGALEEGESWMVARRQLDEALVRLSVPACKEPTVIRVRSSRGDGGGGGGARFAEVRIFADRAEGRVVNEAGETVLETVELERAERHWFTGVTVGDAVTLTVDERDVVRVPQAALPSRGELRIQPARCGDSFSLADFSWYTLKEKSDEVLFYQTLDNEPAPVLSPEEALEAFKVAPGFEVELVAAEPLVEDPVAMAWDEYGRLYVVEMRGFMPDAYGSGADEPVGQVVRLEDTDGDGLMDSSEVFLGGLVLPRAVAVVNEGILVGEPPNLWLCELADRRSLCENKHRVGSYGAAVAEANVEHMENRLLPALDNWLYNSKSTRSVRLANGQLQEREGPFRGQWGMTKDNYGRLFYNHNSTWLQADLFSGEDLVGPGSTSSAAGLGVNLTDPSEVFSVRVNPGVNRAYLENTLREDGRLHRATAVSGLVAYRGHQFPADYASDIFVPEPGGNVVAQFAIGGQGMELTAAQRLYDDETWGQRGFLASTDERFRPVDAMNGPDGALYIIDMYRGIIQDDHYLTDELRDQIFKRELETPLGNGRIWRVRHSRGKVARDIPDLAGAANDELLVALTHPNGWVRDTAQRLLLSRPGSLQSQLAAISAGNDTLAAIHAIWTLEGRGELTRELTVQLASMADTQRQLQALRAGRSKLQPVDVKQLYALLQQAPEVLRMQLAFVMGDYAAEPSIRQLLQQTLASSLDSPYVTQAVLRAVRSQEVLFLRELLAGDVLETETTQGAAIATRLAASAYRSLRGDLSATEPAPPALLALLELAQSRGGAQAWQQIAMLQGFAELALVDGFVPAKFEAAPAIFSDGSISEKDPLWNARLAGRRAFTWPGDELALGLKPLSPEQLLLMKQGKAFYPTCAACHGATGAGTPGLAPAIAGASWVTGPPEWLTRIILQGMSGPVEVNGEPWDGVMPPHGHLAELDDATLAGLMTYMRRSWGNKADPVSLEMVANIRAASEGRDKPWTAVELQAVPFDRGFGRFEGEYTISFLTLTVEEVKEGLHLSVPMYGSGLMTQLSDTMFAAAAGDEKVQIEFVIEESGSVNKLVMHRKGEKVTIKRKEE